jgi:glycosyltransferase involved in cell wall biosynthesis
MKVLHIVESFGRGAVESWLISLAQQKEYFTSSNQWHFFTIETNSGERTREIQECGCTVFSSGFGLSQKGRFLRELRSIVTKEKYDVVHSHHDFLSGFYAMALIGLRVKFIVHSHNNDAHLPMAPMRAKFFLPLFSWMIRLRADAILSISQYSLNFFKEGLRWDSSSVPAKIIYYGIDTLKTNEDLASKDQGVTDGFRLLFAGRLIEEKGPLFALDVAKNIAKLKSSVEFLVVGEGDQLAFMQHAAKNGPPNLMVRFLGWRDDVLSIMRSCDVFLFPRDPNRMEGYGFVMLEAQAMGALCAISRGVSEDTIVEKQLVEYMPNMSPAKWAQAIVDWESKMNQMLSRRKRAELGEAAVIANRSLKKSFLTLESVYNLILK